MFEIQNVFSFAYSSELICISFSQGWQVKDTYYRLHRFAGNNKDNRHGLALDTKLETAGKTDNTMVEKLFPVLQKVKFMMMQVIM